MLHSMMNALFGCGHQRTTFPITPRRMYAGSSGVSGPRSGTYVACLDCGQEFAYDWKSMRIGEPVAVPGASRQTQPSFR
jgi:hypothetical protein